MGRRGDPRFVALATMMGALGVVSGASQVVVQGNRIVVAGVSRDGNDNTSFAVARYYEFNPAAALTVAITNGTGTAAEAAC